MTINESREEVLKAIRKAEDCSPYSTGTPNGCVAIARAIIYLADTIRVKSEDKSKKSESRSVLEELFGEYFKK